MLSPIYDLKPFDLMNNVSFYHHFLDNNSMPTTFNAGKRTIFFFKAGSSKVKTIHLFNCRQDATWWWTQATAAEHQTEDKTQTYKNSNQQWWTKIMKSSLK